MRNELWTSGVLACLALAGLAPAAAAQTAPSPHPTTRFVVSHPELPTTALRLHRQLSGIIRGGEVRRYALRLDAGQFAALRIPQLTGNLAAVVFDPDGAVVAIVDQNGLGHAEVVTIDARTSGEYTVQLAMFEWDAADTSYSIEWTRVEQIQYDTVGRAAQLFESWYDPENPGAALLILRDGEVAYEGAIGVESTITRRPISLHSPFDLASISKQFTAYSIALLVERGQISLSDDIRRYLPEMPDYGTTITVQHLLEHTSGLRDWDGLFGLAGTNIEDGISTDDVLAMAARQSVLNFTPGHEQRYSNTGYVLLAKIVERVTGEPFDQWTRANVFVPLGMRDCSFSGAPSTPARVASFGTEYPQPTALSTNRIVTMGSSGLECSALDLVTWLNNYESGRLGGAETLTLVTQPTQTPTGPDRDYVFGNWHGEREGHTVVGHQGLAAGFRTSLRSFPDDQVEVIYLANDGNDATYERVRTIENLFLGITPAPVEAPTDDYVPSSPQTLNERQINELLGRYRSDEINTDYEVVRTDQGIVAMNARTGALKLAPQGEDAFSSDKWFAPSLTFVRDGAKVTGFRVESEDVGSLFFRRVD